MSLKEQIMPKDKYINIYLHQIAAIVFIILQLWKRIEKYSWTAYGLLGMFSTLWQIDMRYLLWQPWSTLSSWIKLVDERFVNWGNLSRGISLSMIHQMFLLVTDWSKHIIQDKEVTEEEKCLYVCQVIWENTQKQKSYAADR